jgi:zinc protease
MTTPAMIRALLVLLLLPTLLTAQPPAALPLDPAVRTGRLPNGVTYFVRENREPRGRAELRLVVTAGSILEESDQQGLAHFVEHMAFNGTRRFERQAIVNYLESIGMRFGPDLNAYTSFDETVYMLQLPTDSAGVLERGVDILGEWAGAIAFDSLEIERERGVVIEEWRGGRGVEARIRDRQLPVLLRGSQYARRLPIGSTQVLDTFHHERLRAFYRDWYRPDLMAVVAVGDFDAAEVVERIRARFGSLAMPAAPKARTESPVPTHDETLYSIVTDREASRVGATVYFKHAPTTLRTVDDYRTALARRLMTSMLNQRMHELTQRAQPPYQFAYSSYSGYTPTLDVFVLGVGLDETSMLPGISAMLAEAERARRFGFTASELAREKADLLRAYERAHAERERTESSSLAGELVGFFTDGDAAPGIAYEFELASRVVPAITLEEINRMLGALMTPKNRVVAITAPEKPGLVLPTEAQLARLLDSAASLQLTAYEDVASDRPLMATMPTPGRVTKEKVERELGIIRWTLSNRATVILKPTDFKNDEILLTAFSPGGTSIVADAEYIDAATATAVATEGGVGDHSQIELQKLLAGRAVSAYPYIGELYEGVGGSASPRDVETMLQLIHLYLTRPRFDSIAFVSFRTKSKTAVRNRTARPESAMSDSLTALLTGYHVRRRPWTEESYDRIDPTRAMAIYRDRFADASDFTFVFVGSFSPDTLRPLVERYIASLPARGRTEKWRDIGVAPVPGVVEREIRRGSEPKAQVQIVYNGPFTWTRQNRHEIYAMSNVLEIMLREALREEKGGTYGVGVGAVPIEHPRGRYSMMVSFGCAPERVDELVATARATVDSLKRFGPSAENLAKVRESSRRENEVSLRENRYWLGQIQFHLMHDEPLDGIVTGAAEYEKVTADQIRDAAVRYFDPTHVIKVVLVPETTKGAGDVQP